MTTMAQQRAWRGPALLGQGFRPFFLFAALWAAAAMAVWILWLAGAVGLPSALPPVAWHVHELLFGYVPAVIAGFLLTAIPNWTGRLPVAGLPLAGLVAAWLAGRLAVAASLPLGPGPALAVALVFPVALVALAAREIVAAGNRRNLVVVALLGLLIAGEAVFAVETLTRGASVYGQRIGLAAVLTLVMLIGGRITPSFTSSWLRRQGATDLPAPFGRIDAVGLGLGAAGLAAFVAAPALPAAGGAIGGIMLASAAALGLRQARWRPAATRAEPLLGVLHLGHAFLPAGFLVAGAGSLLDDPAMATAAVHLWTMGAVGLMTLAVMTRASRGHTGRALAAPPSTTALYLLLVVATLARVAAAFAPELGQALLAVAGLGWILAFAGFAALYGPMLVMPRGGA